jgi:1-deoxy-D-xylulose-5-phosphate synthase
MFALANQVNSVLVNSLLDKITSSQDVKKLSTAELTTLAKDIREEIVRNLNKTGGHLASNLGVVEVTLALHYVFNSPEDKILFDVGHQCYVHKMLTSRREQFNTLRQYKGLSGFINPLESEHDAFLAGHSSTSVSLAVGMAIARDLLKQKHKVIALIGDGGLTGGMALEAINHLGHLGKDVLIILNDNEMSISENVGGFSQYMKRIKETFFYKEIKEKIHQIEDKLEQSPLTTDLRTMIESVKKEAKAKIETPGIVFEKLGIDYSGPIDGHDIQAVISAFNTVKDKNTPQLIHIITQKGKGYAPAEQDAIKYHGVSAHSLEPSLTEPSQNGNGINVAAPYKAQPVKAKGKTYSEVFSQALVELAPVELNMVVITPATAEGSDVVKFAKAYPDRFFDVAICEQHAVTMAAGMAKTGLKPVVSIYSTFLQRAMDQVIHDVAILKLPVIFGIDRAGLVEDGETHQGVFDIAYLRSIPNFTVLAPKDGIELRDMLASALKNADGPVAIRFPRSQAIASDKIQDNKFSQIDYRRWEVINIRTPKDTDTAILAYGSMVDVAQQAIKLASEKSNGKNISPPLLINARSSKPLDTTLLTELSNSVKNIITLEEGCLAGGFGTAILEWASEQKLKNPKQKRAEIFCLGVTDQFIEHGNRNILLKNQGLDSESIANFIENLSV